PSDALGEAKVQAAGTQREKSTGMAEGSPETGTRPVRALGAAVHDLTTERHEPDEERSSCPDLWGTAGEIPAVYPAVARPLWRCARRVGEGDGYAVSDVLVQYLSQPELTCTTTPVTTRSGSGMCGNTSPSMPMPLCAGTSATPPCGPETCRPPAS